MLKRLGRRPSPTTVIACLALFFAVAGGSAIALQGRNTVDSGDIKKGAVKTSDIANNAVTTKKIKANAVRTGDIQNGQVRPADLAADEAYHRVGTPGNPGFEIGGDADCIWGEATMPPQGDPFNEPAFYKDSGGIVRLTGAVMSLSGPGGDAACDEVEDFIVFRLPEGYRPPEVVAYPSGGAPVPIIVTGEVPLTSPSGVVPPGSVLIQGPSPSVLDVVTFRAAGTGTGLPRRGGTDRLTPEMLEMLGFDG